MKRKINPWFPVLIHPSTHTFPWLQQVTNSPNNNHRSFTLPSKIKILRMNFMTCIIFCIAGLLYYIFLFPCMLQFVGVDPGLISSPWILILTSCFLSLGNEKVRHFRKPWLKIMDMLEIWYGLTYLRTTRDKSLICTYFLNEILSLLRTHLLKALLLQGWFILWFTSSFESED